MSMRNVIRGLAVIGMLLCLVVVVLGAWTRLNAAGLGCPDWPGCYGHLTPTGAAANPESVAAYPNMPLDVTKAWLEMIHRYAATTLGFVIVLITALAAAGRRQGVVSLPFTIVLLATVVFQGILGMLTVTWLVKPVIVTLHLLGGLSTLALLAWLALATGPGAPARGFIEAARAAGGSARAAAGAVAAALDRSIGPARRLAIIAFIALGVQIALGGWTSSNYAAVACPDFPKCQNQWLPEADYADAFVLWRGLGVNYEGGVLEGPARIAIHFTHRLGAIVATIALLLAAFAVWRRPALAPARGTATAVALALILQLLIGITMVEKGFPLWIATAHNAGAAVLVLVTVALNWQLAAAARLARQAPAEAGTATLGTA